MDIRIKGIYKHFKGDYYIVEDLAINCDNDEEYVVYRALYGNNKLFVRNKNEFMSDVDKSKYPDVIQNKRFEFQNIESVKN